MPRASPLLLLYGDGRDFASLHPLPHRGGCGCPARCGHAPPPLHDGELHVPLRGPLQVVALGPFRAATVSPSASALPLESPMLEEPSGTAPPKEESPSSMAVHQEVTLACQEVEL
jgi:hypothetical protein